MIFLQKCALFFLGGGVYTLLELLWRGRSHGSMFLLGGSCFLLIGTLGKKLRRCPLALLTVLFSGIVTGLELLTGLLVNRQYRVWDYRRMPCNYLGQICLGYSLLWMPVSLLGLWLYRKAEKLLERKP
jgi:uncharacterized membrane protein